jgi:hypothetical protein
VQSQQRAPSRQSKPSALSTLALARRYCTRLT